MAVAPAGGQVVVMPAPVAPATAPTPTPAMAAAPKADKPPASPPATPAKPPEPKARIPLEEVESIHFERSPGMTARFVGQPNLDFTMPGLSYKPEAATKDDFPDDVFAPDPKDPKYLADKKAAEKAEPKKEEPKKAEPKKAEEQDDVNAPPPGTTAAAKIARLNPKKNGVRDLNLALYNLRPSPIKQVTVTCQTDKGPTSWRLDTSDSEDWPIVVRRSGTESSADLFLEPPPGDCFEKDFTINLTYEDNQNANATAKADAHTKSDLAVDPKAPAIPPLFVRVHLAGDDVLTGTFEGIAKDALLVTTPWKDKLAIPLTRVVGVHFAQLDRKESPASFARRLKARGSEDLLLAQTKSGEVVAIAGVVEGTEDDRMHFRYQGKSRTLPLELVEGLVLAARTESDPADQVRSTFLLPDGMVVSGRWKDLDTSVWKVELGVGAGDEAAGRGGRRRPLPRRPDDLPLRPHAQQGRGDPVLRPQAPLAAGRQPAGRADQDRRPDLSARRVGPLPLRPDV